ncbi:MAG TPA: cytochrome c-type biogenesis CcmF C-terminal domain-containing protein, partial [Thermoanaerobaculaceae bacterium]|nr:cytochrome c-type biogenesis CcmF C-terminal domain-containing protein [Thermoanaerobaculaceae bacterium]
ATFLTRSGVLADFSVHSFVDLGITAWLVGNLVVFLLLGIGFLAWRWREIPSQHGDEPFWTRTVLTVVGIGVLLGAAAMVLLGTSAPLLTRLATKPSQVGPAFYNQVMLPIGIALALLLALIPHLGWKETGDKLRVRLPVSGAVALMATAAALGLGARGGLYLAFLAAAVFAAASNAWRLVGATRAGSISRAGAHLTHLGLTLMLVGIITSSGFDRSQKVTLPEGAEVHAFDRTLVFQGVDTQSEPGKQHMLVQVRQGSGTPWLARPVMWKNPKSGQLVANPDLHVGLAHDIYIAPVEINPGRSAEPDGVIELGKGESQAVGAATLTFQDFDRGGGHAEGQQLSVGATLTLALSGEPTRTVVPRLGMSEKGMTSSREALLGIPGGWVEVAGINADLGRVRLKLGGIPGVHAAPGEPASFVAELTIKPGISLVWIGLLVLLAGATLALARRRSETALAGPPAPAETPAT